MWPVVVLYSLVIVSGSVAQSSAPGCAISCWENTKYVSKCLNDAACLCSEPEYQNSVYQCIYSQCDTAHFGSALHHTITQCVGTENQMIFDVPPVLNHDSLRRRREEEYLAGIKIFGAEGSLVPYPTESAPFPIQSVPFPLQSVGGPYSPSPTASPPPYFPLNTVTSPAVTSATPTEPLALPASTTAGPLLFSGLSPECGPSIPLGVVSTVMLLFFAL
ncbi:hypothetical protein LSUE1_G004725 [Lachnellula suecica]|uniref:CFEM domain-containing protein n=1 Tax=Lachnellula suecica TaxID=602035 RepID=A0A8T9C193_9HELO|nr:hypothetical protein LSUE1_G004725 [Lachnellula suecica]